MAAMACPPATATDSDSPYVIDLPTALRLAERNNPTIALGREAVVENMALQEQAAAMLLPSLAAGSNVRVHRGALQRDTGEILRVDSQSLYFGGGAGAVGAGTVAIPAVRIIAPLGDALLSPLAARQRVAVARFEARATSNAVLLEVANRYVDLLGAEEQLRADRQAEADIGKVAEAVRAFVKVGQARKADLDRVQTRVFLTQNETHRAEEQLAVASAQLVRVLDLDPAVRLQTVARALQGVQLVDASYDLESLIAIALRCRPEVAAAGAAIQVNETRLRQEQVRPFLPTLSAGFSAGDFGGGSDLAPSRFDQFAGRTDFDVLAVWTLWNAGVGNLAVQRTRRAEVDQAVSRRMRTINRVREEVAEAYAVSAARRRQMDIARQQQATADSGFREELIRTRGGEGLPIEAVNSFDLAVRARLEVIAAVVEYNQAQFRLFVALGNPPIVALPDSQAFAAKPPDPQVATPIAAK
jgi:outer membrane protein TolC